MSQLILSCIFVIFLQVVYGQMNSCSVPPLGGGYVTTPDGQQCTSVVKTHCNLMIPTTSWRRGTHVQANCAGIPRNTAIATFAGPGNCYGCSGTPFQHAAIFESCQSDGINVIDQWVGRPTHRRLIRTNGSGSNGANNFYTISR